MIFKNEFFAMWQNRFIENNLVIATITRVHLFYKKKRADISISYELKILATPVNFEAILKRSGRTNIFYKPR